MKPALSAILASCLLLAPLPAAELHVAPNGSDTHPGTVEKPFATLEAPVRVKVKPARQNEKK